MLLRSTVSSYRKAFWLTSLPADGYLLRSFHHQRHGLDGEIVFSLSSFTASAKIRGHPVSCAVSKHWKAPVKWNLSHRSVRGRREDSRVEEKNGEPNNCSVNELASENRGWFIFWFLEICTKERKGQFEYREALHHSRRRHDGDCLLFAALCYVGQKQNVVRQTGTYCTSQPGKEIETTKSETTDELQQIDWVVQTQFVGSEASNERWLTGQFIIK